MANRDFSSARGARLRDSIRIHVAEEVRAKVTEAYLFVEVLTGVLKLKTQDFFCAQDFLRFGFYDLTFKNTDLCRNFHQGFITNAANPKLVGLKPEYLFVEEEVLLTLHVFNPFIREEDIICFLYKYCSHVRFIRKLMNGQNIWNGKRQYVVRFKRDDTCPGGLRQPPAVFSIGPDKGRVYFRGQPHFCRACLSYGHLAVDCNSETCTSCNSTQHPTKKCPEKRCDLCNDKSHLFRDCPRRQKSYAEAASRGKTSAKEAPDLKDTSSAGMQSREKEADISQPLAPRVAPGVVEQSREERVYKPMVRDVPQGDFSEGAPSISDSSYTDPKPQRQREAERMVKVKRSNPQSDTRAEPCERTQATSSESPVPEPQRHGEISLSSSFSGPPLEQQSIWSIGAETSELENSGVDALLNVMMDTSESAKRVLNEEEFGEEPEAKKSLTESSHRIRVSDPGGTVLEPFSPISDDEIIGPVSDSSEGESVCSENSMLEIRRGKT